MSTDCDLEDGDWYKKQFSECRSLERLEYLSQNVAYDKWENAEYTKDDELMAELRALREKKLEELSE